MKNNLNIVLAILILVVLACACAKDDQDKNAPPTAEKPVAAEPAPQATAATDTDVISQIKWSEYDAIYNTNSKATDLQKDALWEKFQDKNVLWQGTVAEVGEGTFGGLILNIKMNPNTLTNDIALTLKDNQKDRAITLTKDTKISFTGKLKSYGGAFLPLTMSDGVIK